MTVHHLRATTAYRPTGIPAARPHGPVGTRVRPSASLDPRHFSRRLVVFTPSGPAIEALVDRARRELSGLASMDAIHRVVSHNPDCLWAITRRDHYRAEDPVGEGFLAFLMLNQQGLKKLLAGTFDASDPDVSLLAAQNEKPAGIYIWAAYARGPLAGGFPLVFDKIRTPLYGDVDLYARAVTADGSRFLAALGFHHGASDFGIDAPHLHVFRRAAPPPEPVPSYDSYQGRGSKRELSVTVARSIEDLMRVVTVRSAVYVAEQECPYDEEFDGNDLSATHLIGYVGDEPAGCLRIRYFADFAKIERLAVRKEFRRTRLSFHLVRAGIELCRVKGYRKLYGHAQKRLVDFWSRFGFHTFEGGQDLVFSDFDYVEMVLDAAQHPHAISIGIDPYVIIRPEGRWHLPGVLEQSSGRAVTRPSTRGAGA